MNISLVVPKTILLKCCCLLASVLFLGNFSICAQSQKNNTDWQQQIDHIEQMSGRTPWQWATNMSVQWFDLGSSQNRSTHKTTTSLTQKMALPPITATYQLRDNQLILEADFGRMLHTQIKVNDRPFKGNMEPADFDTLTTYSYASIIGKGSIICKWSIAGETHQGKLEAPEDLALWMSKCDPSGRWKLNPANHLVEGKMDKEACGILKIRPVWKRNTLKIDPVIRIKPIRTILYLEEGTQFISFQEPGNPVLESIVLEAPVKQVQAEESVFSPSSPLVTFVQQPDNSFLLIQNLEKMPGHQLSVFNRWGKEIFNTIKYQNNWNGTSQDLTIPEGVYYYVLNNGKGETYTGCFNFRL